MTPLEAALIAVAATVAIVAGVYLLGGLACALIVGGVLMLGLAGLLYDPKTQRRRRTKKLGQG